MPIELLTALDHISEVTLKISSLYEELTYLKINEVYMPDYEEKLSSLIERLKTLKQEEDEYYKIFDEISYAFIALNYFQKYKIDTSKIEGLCAMRIVKRITRINAEFFIENPEAIPEGTVNPEHISYLEGNGFTEQDSIIILLRIAIAVEKSLATALNNIYHNSIKDIKHDNVKALYIRRNLEQPLVIGEEFESELISSNYTLLKNHLKEDLADLDASSETKQYIINALIDDNLRSLIATFLTSEEPEIVDEAYLSFKAHILHLSTPELNTYKQIISFLSLIYPKDAAPLLREIDYVIDLRKKAKEK